MGIAKSLRKAGRLGSFASGLKAALGELNKDDSLDQYLQLVGDLRNKIGQRFDPRANKDKISMTDATFNDPFLMSQSPDMREMLLQNIEREPDKVAADTETASRESLTDIANFVIDSLGKYPDVSADIKSSALSGLDLFRQSKIPGKKEKPELFEISETEGLYDATGKEIVPPRKKPGSTKVTDKFKGISAKGYWEVDDSDPANPQLKWIDNPSYKPDVVGGDNYADFSGLIGELNEGIGRIQLIKSAKSKDGKFTVPDPYGLGTYELTQDELTTLKEQVKKQYSDKAIKLTTQQGLNPAVEDVRKILKANGNDLEAAIDKFKELNPGFTDDQIRILTDYFTLFLL